MENKTGGLKDKLIEAGMGSWVNLLSDRQFEFFRDWCRLTAVYSEKNIEITSHAFRGFCVAVREYVNKDETSGK